jgi:hypothetical protein
MFARVLKPVLPLQQEYGKNKFVTRLITDNSTQNQRFKNLIFKEYWSDGFHRAHKRQGGIAGLSRGHIENQQ